MQPEAARSSKSIAGGSPSEPACSAARSSKMSGGATGFGEVPGVGNSSASADRRRTSRPTRRRRSRARSRSPSGNRLDRVADSMSWRTRWVLLAWGAIVSSAVPSARNPPGLPRQASTMSITCRRASVCSCTSGKRTTSPRIRVSSIRRFGRAFNKVRSISAATREERSSVAGSFLPGPGTGPSPSLVNVKTLLAPKNHLTAGAPLHPLLSRMSTQPKPTSRACVSARRPTASEISLVNDAGP